MKKVVIAIVFTTILLVGLGNFLNEWIKQSKADEVKHVPCKCCGYINDGYSSSSKATEPEIRRNILQILSPKSIVFEDDFDNLTMEKWIPFGSPSPQILTTAEGRYGIFDNNGDSWCDSGAYSKQNFTFNESFVIEADIFLRVTNTGGCWDHAVIGLTRKNEPSGSGYCPDIYPYGLEWGICWVGDACWASPPEKRGHAYFHPWFWTENGTGEGGIDNTWINADNYTNSWHNYKIVVRSDRIVEFYVDDGLIYISTNRLNETVLQGKKLFLGIRSYGASAGKSYHDFVRVYTIEEKADLTLNESDISFSNPNPKVGETIKINVTIHNIGNAEGNAIVKFYDGDPYEFHFKKYEGNPVLTKNASYWDDLQVCEPWVILENGKYKMWYTGCHDDNEQGDVTICYAESIDGINWIRCPCNPVLSTGSGWEYWHVQECCVLKINNTYKMWYSGYDGGNTEQIGYAYSDDGINWTKYAGNPVVKRDDGAWDRNPRQPSVLYEDGIYKMWYCGRDPTNPNGITNWIGYATSLDGINWTKHGKIFIYGEDNQTAKRPFVIKHGNYYILFYSAAFEKYGFYPPFYFNYTICYAISTDGINWTKKGVAIHAGENGSWDEWNVYRCCISKYDNNFYLWYDAKNCSSMHNRKIGLAVTPIPQAFAIKNISVPAYGTINISVNWTPLTAGQHDIYVVIENVSEGDQNYSNNIVYRSINTSKGDNTPPVTLCILSGILGKNGWYISDVTVALNATDDISGVNVTYYKLDGEEWNIYNSSFTIENSGEHILSFYSIDNAGNIEEVKTRMIKIDKDLPWTNIVVGGNESNGWYTSNVVISLIAYDSHSGVDYTLYRVDGGNWRKYGKGILIKNEGEHEIEYYSVDVAGNTESINFFSFKIDKENPHVRVIYPNGGEIVNGIINIRWDATDVSHLSIDLYYSNNSGMTWYLIASDEENDGAYEWDTTGVEDGMEFLIKVVGRDEAGHVGEDESDGTFTVYNNPVAIHIQKPREGYLYIFDKEIMPIPGKRAIVAGKIMIVVDASSGLGIEKLEFYIDNDLKHTDNEMPYSWLWDEFATGIHTIEAIAYDNGSNTANQKVTVWRLF